MVRELQEEIGYKAGKNEISSEDSSCDCFANEIMSVFLAENLEKQIIKEIKMSFVFTNHLMSLELSGK